MEKVFKGTKRYIYYVCSGQKNKKNSCTGVRYRIDFMDQFLKDKILNKILSEENYPIIYNKIQSLLRRLKQSIPKYTENLKRELASVDKRIDNLLEAISRGVVDQTLAKEKLECFKRKKVDLESKILQQNIHPLGDSPLSFNLIST